MVKIGTTTIEGVNEITELKKRVFVEKPRVGTDVAHRESKSGYGREWQVKGIIDSTTLADLIAEENVIEDLSDGTARAFDLETGVHAYWNTAHWGDHWTSVSDVDVLVLEVEFHEVAGRPLSREYSFRLYEVAD
jgi:hypothetical protein